MKIYRGLEELPARPDPSALTIGNFDGVHLGHQHVLAQLRRQAQEYDAVSVAMTFDPHPAFIHRPDAVPGLLTGLEEKLSRLEATGIDAVVVVTYTPQFAAMTPEEFVSTYFVDALNPAVVVVGRDLRFGRDNSGDFSTMVQLGERFGFDVTGVEDYEVGGAARARCSSTAIRMALEHGDVEAAIEMLGRPHSVTGEVVHGEARGRALGFPTANLAQDSEGMVPADGVYAGWVSDLETERQPVSEQAARWPAAISVGSNPTFHGVERVVEAHVIDRQDPSPEHFDLYGRRLRVEFLTRLRGMVAYEGPEKLVEQMHQDVEQTRQVLADSAVRR
ncbi:bifunctional riboflavin kinase/FAD synthetase [Nesterenkonia alba]|uniref:bifunctional riboflavin kinase/FAD synthetase n=1 Tax=Nesterenkonia alba TaxID=515814 RepID=UPI0003B7614B|nr:bifunctional riboflavin kinase/FAD synthetase [Nesterenkonia alba]